MIFMLSKLVDDHGRRIENQESVRVSVDLDDGLALAFDRDGGEGASAVAELFEARVTAIHASGMRVKGYEKYSFRGQDAYRRMEWWLRPVERKP